MFQHIFVPRDGTHSVRALVPLDGLTRMLEAVDSVAVLVAAFSSPGQGVIHLLQIARLPEDVSEGQREVHQDSRA